MSKILYLAPFDCTGYGRASIDYYKSMVAAGISVVPKQINLGKPIHDSFVERATAQDAQDCDVILTHCIPDYFQYDGYFKKNIGLFAYETNVIPKSWVKRIKLMDEIWVINTHMKSVLKQYISGQNIKVVPHAIDLNRFSTNFNVGPIGLLKLRESPFVFYTIGEFVSRKNLEDVLKAYLSEFAPHDNCLLFIKTWKSGVNSQTVKKEVNNLINYVKTNLKLSRYPNVQVCTDYWSDSEIDRLHYEADTYVSLSHGEAWDLSAMAAIGFNSTPIVSRCTGYLDYITPGNGFTISGQQTVCFGGLDAMPSLYNGRDTWFQPNIVEAKDIMRKVYSNYRGCRKVRCQGIKTIAKFGYNEVGKIILKTLK